MADDPDTAGASITGLQKLATPRAKAKLAELSGPGNPESIRQPAVQALGELGDPAYCSVMLNVAEESQQYSRFIALRAAGYLCGARVIPLARSFLDQSDPSARFEAAYALGNSASPKAIPILIALLRDADPNVRRAASDSLATLTHRKSTAGTGDTTEAEESFHKWTAWQGATGLGTTVYRIDQCAPATPLR
jgi:HEAT repeat protein